MHTRPLALLLSALVMSSCPSLAQPATTPPTALAPTDSQGLIDITFGGGTLQDFVNMLIEKHSSQGTPLNIFVPRGELREVPPITLKRVTVATAIRALDEAMGAEKLRVNFISDGDGAQVIVITDDGPFVGPENQLTEVISLNALVSAPWLEGGATHREIPLETLLTAIERAVTSVNAERPATLRFHPESGLLVVTGTVGQIRAAMAVVESLSRDLRRRGHDFSVIETSALSTGSHKAADIAAQLLDSLAPESERTGDAITVTPSEDGRQVVINGPRWALVAGRVSMRALAAGNPEVTALRQRLEAMQARLEVMTAEQDRHARENEELRKQLNQRITENATLRETVQRLQNTPR